MLIIILAFPWLSDYNPIKTFEKGAPNGSEDESNVFEKTIKTNRRGSITSFLYKIKVYKNTQICINMLIFLFKYAKMVI